MAAYSASTRLRSQDDGSPVMSVLTSAFSNCAIDKVLG